MIHIVSCTDRNYVMPTSVMMLSACLNNEDENITFHLIIDASVTEREKTLLSTFIMQHQNKFVKFYLIDDKTFDSYPKIGEVFPHISKAAYYRLLVSSILPSSLSKVIYLDGDILVHHGLGDLWNTDILFHPIAAIPDMYDEEERYERLGYAHSLGYFNSGVLLINLDYWRTHNLIQVFMEFIKNHANQIKFHDQDVLNYVFRDTKLTLPLKYNAQNGFFFKREYIGVDLKKYSEQLDEAVHHPVIIHFTWSQKPWIIGCQHPNTEEFNKYRNMTPWRHRSIFDTLKYSGLRHTIGYYARKWGFKAPMDNPYAGFS